MWMWASSRPCPPIIISKTIARPVSHFPVSVSVSATSHRQRRRAPPPQIANSSSDAEEIGGLGHAVLTALKSNTIDSKTPITNTQNPNPNQLKQEKQKQQDRDRDGDGERQQISGSDVLWALQKAAAQKKQKASGGGGKKMKKGLKNGADIDSSNGDGMYEEDYSNARPLNIRSDWVTRLDDLERRLKELSET